MDEGVGHVNIGRRDLFALGTGLLDLLHVPYAESGAAELGPDLCPALVLCGLLAVGLALDAADKWPREVDLAGMCGGELDDGPDLWMQRGRWGLLLVERGTRRQEIRLRRWLLGLLHPGARKKGAAALGRTGVLLLVAVEGEERRGSVVGVVLS
jgi:hypothetical protein